MIEIKININNLSSNINIDGVASEISQVLQQITNSNVNVKVNKNDDKSMSPIGIYKTAEYLKLTQR